MEVIRTIDKLGRIVLPMDFRKKLGLEGEVDVSLCINGESIMVKGLGAYCRLCGSKDGVCELNVCSECIRKIKVI